MAPVVPFVPLIAAAVTAGGGIATSMIASRNAKKQAASAMDSERLPLLSDLSSSKSPKIGEGILPNYTSPLGDTSTASVSRRKLLGN